ncbi:ArsB/NhaD family transporter [Salmonella enterica]|uniref:ArsB/NhaD family transporter n=1 Tax=Salmonella enterica TaxID=28901 RepID=UPI00398C7CC3
MEEPFFAVFRLGLRMGRSVCFELGGVPGSRVGNGVGSLIFTYIVLVGSAVAALFAKYGAALILRPLVLGMLLALGFSNGTTLPLHMAVGSSADMVSLLANVTTTVHHRLFVSLGWVCRQRSLVLPSADAIVILRTLFLTLCQSR